MRASKKALVGHAARESAVSTVLHCIDPATATTAAPYGGGGQMPLGRILLALQCARLDSRTGGLGTSDYLRRRFARGGLRPLYQDETAHQKVGKVTNERVRQNEEDLMGLTQCSLCCTLFTALIGGPILLLLAIPGEYGYWAGCGFRVPEVGPTIIARAEFAGGQNAQ